MNDLTVKIFILRRSKMKINKAHCFFEQSGTFKNEFIKLGIPAEDYDIQNEFGQTERSMISPDYARNFICDFIIGKQQVFTQTNLFD